MCVPYLNGCGYTGTYISGGYPRTYQWEDMENTHTTQTTFTKPEPNNGKIDDLDSRRTEYERACDRLNLNGLLRGAQ